VIRRLAAVVSGAALVVASLAPAVHAAPRKDCTGEVCVTRWYTVGPGGTTVKSYLQVRDAFERPQPTLFVGIWATDRNTWTSATCHDQSYCSVEAGAQLGRGTTTYAVRFEAGEDGKAIPASLDWTLFVGTETS
jgi:hypothetical protein